MGVVASWEDMKRLPVGVYEDALLVLAAEGAEVKRQRAKTAATSAPAAPRRRRR